jgi:hypothetical protein
MRLQLPLCAVAVGLNTLADAKFGFRKAHLIPDLSHVSNR